MAGLKRKRIMSARERERVAVHEAGHAVVASVLPGVDALHQHRNTLDAIVRLLLEHEVVDGEDVRRLVASRGSEVATA